VSGLRFPLFPACGPDTSPSATDLMLSGEVKEVMLCLAQDFREHPAAASWPGRAAALTL
jgi:hypothetical protein